MPLISPLRILRGWEENSAKSFHASNSPAFTVGSCSAKSKANIADPGFLKRERKAILPKRERGDRCKKRATSSKSTLLGAWKEIPLQIIFMQNSEQMQLLYQKKSPKKVKSCPHLPLLSCLFLHLWAWSMRLMKIANRNNHGKERRAKAAPNVTWDRLVSYGYLGVIKNQKTQPPHRLWWSCVLLLWTVFSFRVCWLLSLDLPSSLRVSESCVFTKKSVCFHVKLRPSSFPTSLRTGLKELQASIYHKLILPRAYHPLVPTYYRSGNRDFSKTWDSKICVGKRAASF